MMGNKVFVSVVSHKQADMVLLLLDDLEKFCSREIEVIVTVNIPEKTKIKQKNYSFPLKTINNETPKGFGENHNNAFKTCTLPYFCVLNPDIRLLDNPFPALIQRLQGNNIGVVGPAIIDEKHQTQDSARKFLTLIELFKRVLLRKKEIYDVPNPDWIAGMFMLFKTQAYKEVNGFDEAYYLYCEDMDICARLKTNGYSTAYEKSVTALHHAQRRSHKNFTYFIWHIKSLMRFFCQNYRH